MTRTFLDRSSQLLLASMWVLAVGLSLDYFVVGWLVFRSPWVAVPAALLFGVLSVLWFAFPRSRRRAGE